MVAGDSNRFWRLDIKSIAQALFVILALRGMTILMGFDQYVPVIDDILAPIVKYGTDIYRVASGFFGRWMNP